MISDCRVNRTATVLALGLLCVLAFGPWVSAQNRLPPIPPEKFSPQQAQAQQEFKAARTRFGQNITNDVTGPFQVLIRSPQLMNRVRGVGDYVRWESILPPKINEFIAIITAREWTQPYVWNAHYNTALKHGLRPDIGQAVAEGRRPSDMADDEAIAYDFITELHRNRSVSDATYARALAMFGEQGVIDIIGVTGYYTFLSLSQNAARVTAPDNSTSPRLMPFPNVTAW
jgi:4-carboxymuconolactone decarboxylase